MIDVTAMKTFHWARFGPEIELLQKPIRHRHIVMRGYQRKRSSQLSEQRYVVNT